MQRFLIIEGNKVFEKRKDGVTKSSRFGKPNLKSDNFE